MKPTGETRFLEKPISCSQTEGASAPLHGPDLCHSQAGLSTLMVLSDLGDLTQQHSGLSTEIFHIMLLFTLMTLTMQPC